MAQNQSSPTITWHKHMVLFAVPEDILYPKKGMDKSKYKSKASTFNQNSICSNLGAQVLAQT
jgi:hypothetical protein